MKNSREGLYFQDRKAWRSWLDDRSADASEAWLVIQKKHSPLPGLSLDDAVEEALCFGWIDGTLNTRDEHTYLLRFSPRKPNSVWSMNNIRRVEKLQERGSMTEAGLESVRIAQESGQWQDAIDRENLELIPSDLLAALCRTEGATDAYQNLPDSKKKQFLYWLQSAKREETRQKRIAEIVKMVLSWTDPN